MDNHQYDDFDDEQRFKFLTGKNLLICAVVLSLLPAVLGFLSLLHSWVF